MTDLVELVARGENNGGKEEVKEELVVKADGVLNCSSWREADDQSYDHTGEYGDDRFMDSLNSFLLQDITRKESRDQQHDQDKERP